MAPPINSTTSITARYQSVNLLVSFMLVRIEFISESVDGADIVRSTSAADLTAKVLDVLVDEIEISQVIRIIPPEMGGNGLAGEHPVLIDQEVEQQVELFAGGIQQGLSHLRFQGVGVQADLIELYDIGSVQ